MSSNKKLALKLVVTFSTFFLISYFLQKSLDISLEEIESFVASYGRIAPIIYFFLLLFGLTIPFNPISDYIVVIAAAYLFPPHYTIPATFLAHTIAIIVNYFVGKKFGWKTLDILAKDNEMEFLHKLAKRITPLEVFSLRWILPLTAIGIDIVSYSSGMAKLKFSKYFAASIIPWTTLSIVFFTSSNYLKDISTTLFVIPSVVMIIVSLSIYKFVNSRIKK